jgi:phosphoribosylformimino-5-aminoimidazole carboxamide ribotide isomerase
MQIIPAIDLKGGKVVRLEQGRMDRDKTYSDDPGAVARGFAAAGAELIHVVDLDGAVLGRPANRAVIHDLARAAGAPIELGGGIRDLDTIADYLEHGIRRVILGTAAHRDPALVEQACARFPGRIVIGIDAREGKVAIRGWNEDTAMTAVELARRYQGLAVAAIVYTDIARDGMRTGPNVEATVAIARAVKLPVIASGGIKTIEHLRALLPFPEIVGVITGRALYEGDLNLAEAIALARSRA